jgi:hypothetical protein
LDSSQSTGVAEEPPNRGKLKDKNVGTPVELFSSSGPPFLSMLDSHSYPGERGKTTNYQPLPEEARSGNPSCSCSLFSHHITSQYSDEMKEMSVKQRALSIREEISSGRSWLSVSLLTGKKKKGLTFQRWEGVHFLGEGGKRNAYVPTTII